LEETGGSGKKMSAHGQVLSRGKNITTTCPSVKRDKEGRNKQRTNRGKKEVARGGGGNPRPSTKQGRQRKKGCKGGLKGLGGGEEDDKGIKEKRKESQLPLNCGEVRSKEKGPLFQQPVQKKNGKPGEKT